MNVLFNVFYLILKTVKIFLEKYHYNLVILFNLSWSNQCNILIINICNNSINIIKYNSSLQNALYLNVLQMRYPVNVQISEVMPILAGSLLLVMLLLDGFGNLTQVLECKNHPSVFLTQLWKFFFKTGNGKWDRPELSHAAREDLCEKGESLRKE